MNGVLVLDRKGNPISGLRKEDFLISDNGQEQAIRMFSYGENVSVPRSFVLIFENSWTSSPYRESSIKAAKWLIDQLPPQDRMAIVNDRVELLTNFTNDKRLLKEKLDRERREAQMYYRQLGFDRGNGLQYSALMATLRELFDEEDLVPIVIFQTGGNEFLILKPAPAAYRSMERNFGFDDVLNEVARSRATIYSINFVPRFIGVSAEELERNKRRKERMWAPGLPEWAFTLNAQHQQALVDVANASGGFGVFVERQDDAERVYSTVLEAINRRYLIGYYSDAPNDGRRRTVKVEVRGHPEYVVIGRKTYVPR